MLTTIQQTNILTLRGLQCSTAHITEGDNALLYRISHCQVAFGDGEWIHFTGTGYLIRLNAWTPPGTAAQTVGPLQLLPPSGHHINETPWANLPAY